MNDLDKRLKTYFGSKSLSKAQLEQIIEGPKKRPKPVLKYLAVAMAAMLVVGFFYSSLIHPTLNKKRIVESYAKEVSYNHAKYLPMEIETGEAQDINNALSKLNFTVANSTRLKEFGKLVGGRYCHIDDQIAAQLRLINQSNDSLTCYQFKQQHNIQFDKIISHDKVNVHLWTQDSIVFAVAAPKKIQAK